MKTFHVVPITNRLGSFEWVDNTEPLKQIVNREHIRLEDGKDINQTKALDQIRKWLKNIPGNENVHNLAHQHLNLLQLDRKDVVNGFN